MEAGIIAGQQMAAVTEFSAPTPVFSFRCSGPINLKFWALIGPQIVECNRRIQKPSVFLLILLRVCQSHSYTADTI